jgi:multidrug resistance efflux pump
MNPAHTASDLAQAQADLADSAAAAEKCADTFAALQARLNEKQSALGIIQQRRLDGLDADSDAPTAHLLQLDLDGLRPLVDRAAEQHTAACEALQQAQITVQQAQAAHDRATAETAAVALESRLHELESLLLSGIADLDILKKKATGSLHVHGETLYRFSDRLKRFLQQGVLQQ